MGLVDYDGSDSDSDNEEQTVEMKTVENKTLNEDLFFDDDAKQTGTLELEKDDVLEDIVKPKDWELKIAEKTKKKLEKKAKKAAKREKKEKKKAKKEKGIAKIGSGLSKKSKEKVVISAFGALASIADDDSDDSDSEESKPAAPKSKPGMGFLANLPAPKGKDNRSDQPMASLNSFVPPSVSAKKVAPVISAPVVNQVSRFVDSDEDDDNDDETDFFGFSSTPKNVTEVPEIPQMALSSAMEVVGPSRPTNEQIHPSQMYNMADVEMEDEEDVKAKTRGMITDEQAHKLLMRFSHDIGPEEKRSIDEMASSIVDVRVDEAIGPNIKSNILKNLGHRQFAEATAAPLPPPQTEGQMSRKKHQITYLANLAVSREEALKEKWADQRQTKRMAKAKYGF